MSNAPPPGLEVSVRELQCPTAGVQDRETQVSHRSLCCSINITAQIVPTTASAASTAVQTLVSTDQSRPHHHQLHRHPHHHQPPCQSRRRRRRRLATPTPCLSSPWSCPNPPGPQQGCPLCTGPRPYSPSLTGLSLL